MLPLETWRQIFSLHPYHFWQQASGAVPVTSTCNSITREYAWQNADAVGRSEIRAAIASAEKRLREYLRYRVGSDYVVETLAHPVYPAIASDGRWLTVRAPEGYVHALGVETWTHLGDAAVTYSDQNGDGIVDWFEATAPTEVDDEHEVEAFFTLADRMNNGLEERYRLAPLIVASGGGSTTVSGPSWLAVRPIQYEGVGRSEIDPAATTALEGMFAQDVAIYRHHVDATGTTYDDAQATLIWESNPAPGWACCNDAGSDPAGQAYAVARAQVRDSRLGLIAIGAGSYDATTGVWTAGSWGTCYPPDRIILRYKAGIEWETVHGGAWEEIVARLAAAELNRPVCACDTANHELFRWQFDLARAAGANDEQYRIGESALNCPFGTRAGAVYAWNQVKNLRLTRGLAA